MMRNARVVALLLLGVAVVAVAAAGRDLLEEPQQVAVQQADASAKKYKYYGKDDKCYCEDGKDGKDGRPGPPGHPGHDGKDGRDGRNGRDGRDSLVIITYATASKSKTFTYNTTTHQQHYIELISATSQCAAGTKAIACSCGTSMLPPFEPLSAEHGVYGYHGYSSEEWLERVNRITLVANSLSQSKEAKYNDQCTCTGLAVATVKRDDKDYEEEYKKYEEEEEEEEEYEAYEKEKEKERRKKYSPEYKYEKEYEYKEGEPPKAPKKYKKSVHTAGYKGYYGHWTKYMPASQAFTITATATCQEIKLLHHYGKDYGEYGYDKDYYGYDKDDEYKEYKDDDKYEKYDKYDKEYKEYKDDDKEYKDDDKY